jgi:hypothetical protein
MENKIKMLILACENGVFCRSGCPHPDNNLNVIKSKPTSYKLNNENLNIFII